jgi:Ca2+-binding RTX toxin-like protein
MIQKFIPRITVAILSILIVLGAANAIAASNTVSNNHLDELSSVISISDKLPAACKGMTITAIIVCPTLGGTCTGSAASELILGSAYDDLIRGKGGTDCILGGDGDDDIRGGGAGDVCIGGNGIDTFTGCETATQ